MHTCGEELARGNNNDINVVGVLLLIFFIIFF